MTRRDPRASALRALLVSVAALPALPRFLRVPGFHWLEALTLRWFAFQCQRDPARCLSCFGHTLPVCARCTGIYLGLGLGALLLRPQLQTRLLAIWVGAAAALMLLDVFSEAHGLRSAWAPLRVLSGALLSYPVGAALIYAARARWASPA